MLTLIGTIARIGRTSLVEKQREGIDIAKAAGKYKGRKPIEVEDFKQYYDDYMQRRINKNLAKKLRISRPILDKLIQNILANSNRTSNPERI